MQRYFVARSIAVMVAFFVAWGGVAVLIPKVFALQLAVRVVLPGMFRIAQSGVQARGAIGSVKTFPFRELCLIGAQYVFCALAPLHLHAAICHALASCAQLQ